MTNEKKFTKVLPCGTLTSRTGEKFWLISPEPLPPYPWMHSYQQRWSVVPYERIDFYYVTETEFINSRYSYIRDLVTTNPDIQFGYYDKRIEVWVAFEFEGLFTTFDGEPYEVEADVVGTA